MLEVNKKVLENLIKESSVKNRYVLAKIRESLPIVSENWDELDLSIDDMEIFASPNGLDTTLVFTSYFGGILADASTLVRDRMLGLVKKLICKELQISTIDFVYQKDDVKKYKGHEYPQDMIHKYSLSIFFLNLD